MDRLLWRRANRLARFLIPSMPAEGPILDVGSGTGHNAACIGNKTLLEVIEADVVDMHSVGRGPVLFDRNAFPFRDAVFSDSILLFVLQYVPDPVMLLTEIRRVTSGRVMVLQSTYSGSVGRCVLSTREFFSGRLAFFIANVIGLVSARSFSLRPRRIFTRRRLEELVRESGFRIIETRQFDGISVLVSRDLHILEAVTPCSTVCRS